MKIYLALALLSLIGCATARQPVAAPSVPGDPHGSIRFLVYMVMPDGEELFQPWVSSPVYLASRDGLRLLALTDMYGHVTIQKDKIWVEGAQALFFCIKDAIQCSALRVETEWLRGFDEFSVELPIPSTVIQ